MKKVLFALLLLPCLSHAKNSDYIVGAGLSADNNHILGASKETYVVRGGVITNDTHRFLGTFTYSDESKLSKYLGSYDYMYGLGASGRLNTFIGLSAGYKYQNIDTHNNKGFYVVGGQAGVNYLFTSSVSTELGYRILNGSTQEDEWLKDELYLTLDYRF